MPSKYDYTVQKDNGAVQFSINPGATGSREVTSDYTFVSDDLDETLRANASSAITLTVDVDKLPVNWVARVVNQSGNNVTFDVKDSGSGTATTIGSTTLNTAGNGVEIRHLEDGLVSINA